MSQQKCQTLHTFKVLTTTRVLTTSLIHQLVRSGDLLRSPQFLGWLCSRRWNTSHYLMMADIHFALPAPLLRRQWRSLHGQILALRIQRQKRPSSATRTCRRGRPASAAAKCGSVSLTGLRPPIDITLTTSHRRRWRRR